MLSAGQLFAPGFGGIIGVGWVIGLGEWLGLAGPVGATVAFVLGGAITVLVGCCYAELLGLLPACGGEIAYAYDILGGRASFAVGWLLVLANVVTLVFEALGMTWIVATLIPAVGSMPLYTLAGYTSGVGDLALGIGGMALLAWLNVAGLQFVARLQDTLTLAKVALVTIVVAVGLGALAPSRLDPLFGPHPSAWLGVPLGKEAIAPVVNVASTCFAIVGAVVCALVLVLRHRDPARPRPFRVPGGATLPWVALLSSSGLIMVSLASPTGVFGGVPVEWLLLSVWVLGGAVLWARLRQSQPALSEPQRRALILGAERDRPATILPDVT